MSLVYRATLTPTKQELVEAWLPTRAWGDGVEIARKIGEYRFDDPAGEVGVETILFAAQDDVVLQLPLTYRAAPLAGADDFLIGTTDHSVLGARWVYDGCGDPVWADTLATAVLTGGSQSQMYLVEGGERIDIPPRLVVRGSGAAGAEVPEISAVDAVRDEGMTTVVRAGGLELVLARVVGASIDGEEELVGTIGGREVTLAGVRRPA